MSTESQDLTNAEETPAEEKRERKALQVIGWFSIGMAVATIGIYLGYELRCRYKFNRRTPYDFYSNAGEQHVSEFGMGI
ncbi:MAG: hypothetical protein ABSD67_16015 [Terracidiphilus sp.]|jgi:hypothetical protein